MNIRNSLTASKLGLAVGLLCLPILGWTQVSTLTQAEIWRQANDAVGQFKRGHADVLKWETSNAKPEAIAPALSNSLSLANAQEAIRLAWKVHPDLSPALAQLSAEALEALVSGAWDKIEPKLVRRVQGMDEVLRVAAQARKDFVLVVAAQLSFRQAEESLSAAESARELGDRMVAVGNWSKIQQAPLQIAQANAQMNVQKSRLAFLQTQNRVLKSMAQVGAYQILALPTAMRDLPKQISTEQAVQAKGRAIQAQLYDAERFASRDHVAQAFAAYQAAFANAGIADEVLKLHQFVFEETVLHYNGMLKSTWDVLAESQSQIQAATAAVNAQRDFEIAQIDLEWVLLGGEPSSFVSLGGADGAPAAGQ